MRGPRASSRGSGARCWRSSRRSRRTREPRSGGCSAATASSRALFAGDDTTDLDGFHALDGLDVAVRVAVASDEGPEALRDGADIVVQDPQELAALLRGL